MSIITVFANTLTLEIWNVHVTDDPNFALYFVHRFFLLKKLLKHMIAYVL